MANKRRLNRRTQSTDENGNVNVLSVKTYQVKKKKFKDDQMTKDILANQKKARENKKYQKILNKMKIQVKTTENVQDLLELVKAWGFSKNSILSFFLNANQEILPKEEFQKVTFSDTILKQKLTRISEQKIQKQSAKNGAVKNLRHHFLDIAFLKNWLNHAGSSALQKLSHRDHLWVVPVCDTDATVQLVKIISSNPVEILQSNFLELINVWYRQLFPIAKPQPKIDGNADYHQSEKVFVALDCEWVQNPAKDSNKGGKTPVSERDLNNVLSFQLSAYNPQTTQMNRLTIHNDTHEHFQWSELLRGVLSVIEPIATVNEDGTIPKNFKVILLTYFGGVDVSCFGGFETKLHDLMVLRKNYIFSTRYLPFDVRSDNAKASKQSFNSPNSNEFKLSFRFVDVGLIAPPGGLSVLGESVGIPKIDTEQWDLEDGYKKGFYKSHMDVLRSNRPNDYLAYAQLDADITLEYYRQAISLPFFKSWQTKPPATIGSYGASLVYDVLKKDAKNACEMIFNDKLNSGDIANSKGVMGVKPGQAELFKMSINAFFGGFNLAFTSGLYHGRIIDIDLTSAYNVAGLLLPCVNYNDHNYMLVDNSQLHDVLLSHPVHLTADNDFSTVYELIKYNPFIAGSITCQIDLPDDVNMSTIPFQSDNPDYGPCYVRHGVTTIPILDAFNAYRMGGSVKIIDAYIPAQNFKGLSAFGLVQAECLSARNKAKKQKKIAKKNGDMRAYYRYEVEQLLYKLVANSIYGKTGQGTSSSKRARDFDTYDTDEISYSSITNPVIAGLYTSITRYLVTLLYESIESVCDGVVPMNITTDGYTFCLPESATFDESKVRDKFLSLVPEIYKNRCADHFNGVVSGFEVKGDVIDHAFNIKTRVNGTLHYDDSNGGIQALASMRGHDNADVYNRLVNHQYLVLNKENRMTNITELKHHIKNHYGHMETWEQNKVVGLQYDFAYCPQEYFDDGNGNCYLTTLPFSTVAEHDNYKKLGMMQGRAFPLASSADNFQVFIDTMNSSNVSFRKTDVNDDNFMIYCLKNFVAMNQNKLSNKDIYALTDKMKLSRSTIRNYLSRHKIDDGNINFLAGWYYENVNLFKVCDL